MEAEAEAEVEERGSGESELLVVAAACDGAQLGCWATMRGADAFTARGTFTTHRTALLTGQSEEVIVRFYLFFLYSSIKTVSNTYDIQYNS